MDSLAWCSDIAIPTGSDFYYATRFTKAAQSPALICLQAFWLETRAVIGECSDPGVALVKLQWWREELARAREGRAQHPVSQALQDRLPEQVSLTALTGVVDAIEEQIPARGYPDYAAQAEWHGRAGGRIWQAFGQVCGQACDEWPGSGALADLAFGVELIDAIQNLHRDIRTGYRRFPEQALEAAGIAVPGPELSTPATAITRLCTIQAREARAHLAAGYASTDCRCLPLPCRILARLAETLLAELERDDYACLQRRESLTPIRKLFIAWRARWTRQSLPAKP